MEEQNLDDRKIALVGMACRFPGADNMDSFWHNLVNGVESVVALEENPQQPPAANYVDVAAPLSEDIAHFDAGFFGLSAREATLMDPQHRLFIECAWHALESAGIVPGSLPDCGLFAGCSSSEYLRQALSSPLFAKLDPSAFEQQITNDKDYLSTRAAWHLGIGGPVVNVQAACATSLVAVCEAVYALRNGRCSLALAGACTLRIPQLAGYNAQQGMIYATDGHCRPFSTDASGTVFGSGVGVVVLKRLRDAVAAGDDVIAIIDGVAMNNDGAQKVSFTTTSVEGQQRLLVMAMEDAQRRPDDFRAIEAHGTGTLAGDPIEFSALNKVFTDATAQRQFCAIGAVKANVGHLETAAGMAGLIKAALQIRHGWLAPQINFSTPNPSIDLQHSPFQIPVNAIRWENDDPRRAIGVSAFGIGGTNAHIVLSRPDEAIRQKDLAPRSLVDSVIPLSARSENAWHRLAKRYRQAPSASELQRIAWSAQTGRKGMRYRGTLGKDDRGNIGVNETVYDSGKGRLRVIFQFPGQGSQFIGMASELMKQDAVFNQFMQDKIGLLRTRSGLDIASLFNGQAGNPSMNNTAITQPALIAVEISLAQLLMSLGVTPDWVIGHSVGEIAASWAAGAFTVEQALAFAARRGELMASLAGGSMLAVELSESACEAWLSRDLSLAAVNSDSGCVISGNSAAIMDCARRLQEQGIRCKPLKVSHAFHSAMMEPILADLAKAAPTVKTASGAVRYFSALRGEEIGDLSQLDAAYWSDHAREPVRYHRSLQNIPSNGKTLFIEVGPGSTLTALAARLRKQNPKITAVRTLPREDDALSEPALWRQALQKIWRAGVEIQWSSLWLSPPMKVPLPLYPFDPQCWWMGEGESDRLQPAVAPLNEHLATDPLTARIAEIWSGITGQLPDSIYQDFYDAGGHSLMALRLLAQLEREFGQAISMADFMKQPTPAGMRCCLIKFAAVEQKPTF